MYGVNCGPTLTTKGVTLSAVTICLSKQYDHYSYCFVVVQLLSFLEVKKTLTKWLVFIGPAIKRKSCK